MSCGGFLKEFLAAVTGAGVPRPSTWPPPPCRIAFAVWAVLGAALAQQGGLDPPANHGTGELRRARLHAIASSRMFTTVNRNDAVAAIKVGFELTGRARGFLLDAKLDIVDGVAEMKQRLESRSVDILILDFVDYLQLEGAGLIVPDLVGNRNDGGGPRYSYLLLVGASSTAGTIADLRGKNLNYFSRSDSNTGLAWLEVTLGKLKLGRASSFFATARNTTKPQACVLPLFFGTVDACVVDEINLELLKEMNPQLGKLRVLARSTPLIDSVIATPVPPQPYREELLDAIRALHESPRGRQVLMVFKTGRVVRISPGDIEAARALWMEYRRVAGSLPPSTPGLAPFSAARTPVTEIHENRAQKKD